MSVILYLVSPTSSHDQRTKIGWDSLVPHVTTYIFLNIQSLIPPFLPSHMHSEEETERGKGKITELNNSICKGVINRR